MGQAERNRHTRLYRQRLQPRDVVAHPFGIAIDILARDLEHACPHLTHEPDQLLHFVPRRQAAGDRPSIRRLMGARARSGKTGHACPKGAAQFPLHRRQIFGSRFFIKARSPIT